MGKYKKHESEFKLGLVKAHENGKSLNALSKQWGVSKSQLRKWIDQYNSLGAKGLLRRPNQKYTKEFKLTAVESYLNKALSLRDCCLHFNIPSIGILSRWVGIYERLGADGLSARQTGRKTMKEDKQKKPPIPSLSRLQELEKQVLYLQAENELLKKLNALAQKKATPQNKKR